jgi:hypothetical protein
MAPMAPMLLRFLPLLFLPLLAAVPANQDDAGATGQDDAAEAALKMALEPEGIRMDVARGIVSIPATVLVREDLLEYLLVGPRGAGHEGLFLTPVRASLLNAALLALGVEVGLNARWQEIEREPADAQETEPEDLRPEYRILLPEGDGFLLYAAWREGDETYLFRIDDLISNLESGRSMQRHRFVFIGSRFRTVREGEPEVFVADLEQNFISLSFFYKGNTLLTAALPDCEQQTIWVANSWLVPPRGQSVSIVFAREPIASLPAEWVAELPVVEEVPEEEAEEVREGDGG